MTTVEIAAHARLCGLVAAAAVLRRSAAQARATGCGRVGLLLALRRADGALGRVVGAARRQLARTPGACSHYCGVFGAAVALARAVPARWPAVLGGVVLAAVIVCGYALLTKVFPGQLDASDIYARLRAPYSYWNAIGLTAAMGAIGCMWLGARRAGHALLSALAYPAMGLMLLTLMLAYSRGALRRARARPGAVVLHRAAAPARRGDPDQRRRGGGRGRRVGLLHARAQHRQRCARRRTSAGHQLGALIVVMLVLLTRRRARVRLLDRAQRARRSSAAAGRARCC